MMKKALFIFYLLFTFNLQAQLKHSYKNASLTSEERTRLLLKEMTLAEKVGQLRCPLGWEMYSKETSTKVVVSDKFKELIKNEHIGMFWAVLRADPWTQKTLESGLNPGLSAEATNAMQNYVIENTRLGIPLFLAEECPHGHMAIGTTVFPTSIGQASTWDCELIEKMGQIIAKEARLQGAHIGYGPVLDLAREPRWSRTEETYGEDQVLSGAMGAALVKGFQGEDIGSNENIISTLKHFVAYGVPEGGHNGAAVSIGSRALLESYFPPFEQAVKSGALSVMTAYNSIDGIPCTSSSYNLRHILKGDWGFKGFVVSDLGSIEGIRGSHRVAETIAEASKLAIEAGLDVDLGANAFKNLTELVNNKSINTDLIDSAVARVLRLKFQMGLFENPYVDVSKAQKYVRGKENIDFARKVAQKSIILLKNDGLLPLSKQLKNIAVIGPNADNTYNQLGDYTAPQDPDNIVTVLKGIKNKLGNSVKINYVKGCAIRDKSENQLQQAIEAVKAAEVCILVLGGSSARDFKTEYIETGAAVANKNSVSDMESGEGYDRMSLDLLGLQPQLLNEIIAVGKPIVLVHIQGRPLNMNQAAESIPAIINAWYPGQEGGNAIADVLFGDYNPAGRLPISIPRSVGQLPIYYNIKNPKGHDYVEMTSKPLYAFGYGLSYSQFEYSDLVIKQLANYQYSVSFNLKNTGNYDGEEVPQLYIRDEFASVVQANIQLRKFNRIFLKKGESRQIQFILNKEDFEIIDKNLERVVEAGSFTIKIGSASDNIHLEDKINIQ